MKTFPRLVRAASALLLAASALPALASQSITLTGPLTVNYNVCGNATDTATGDCAVRDDTQDGNTLTIGSGVTLNAADAFGRQHHSGAVATTATGNKVNFSGAGQRVYGADANSSADALDATATGNTVTISGAGAAAMAAFGGHAQSSSNATASATGNHLFIENGVVQGVSGGDTWCRDNCTTDASNNTVSITGGTVGGAGYYIAGGSADSNITNVTATASNNTVEIKGSAILVPGTRLYGGFVNGNVGISENNTLNLSLNGVTVMRLDYFQNLNFLAVPASLAASGNSVLAVTNVANIEGAKISVSAAGSLKVGDEIILIDASAGSLIGTPNATVASPQGYQFEIVGDPIASKQLVVQVKSLPPSSTASAAAVPTLETAGLALLALLLAGGAAARMRRS